MAVLREDVARLAGVSPAVVSYVLNAGPRGVARETRDRVLAAVQDLGYRPNGIARSLRTKRTMTLGLVIPDNSNPFFAELARAVEEAAFAAGYTLLVGNATDSESRQTTYLRTFLDRQVDGLLLAPSHQSIACLPELESSGVPWVLLDRGLSDRLTVPQVVVDNRHGSFEAVKHLLAHGHRSVATIAGPADAWPTVERLAGCRAALVEAGLDADRMPIQHTAFGMEAGYCGARDLLAVHPEIEAIFVASDEQAAGALCAIAELGRRCPEDVAIVSFDGIPAAGYTVPALTTVQQPISAMAWTATRLLAQRITEPGLAPSSSEVLLPVELVVRRSCGCRYLPTEE